MRSIFGGAFTFYVGSRTEKGGAARRPHGRKRTLPSAMDIYRKLNCTLA